MNVNMQNCHVKNMKCNCKNVNKKQREKIVDDEEVVLQINAKGK